MRGSGGRSVMPPHLCLIVLLSIAALQRVDFSCRRRLGLGMFRIPLDGGCDRIDDNSRERILKAPICYIFYYTVPLLYVQIRPKNHIQGSSSSRPSQTSLNQYERDGSCTRRTFFFSSISFRTPALSPSNSDFSAGPLPAQRMRHSESTR